jgi:hypothetical protein
MPNLAVNASASSTDRGRGAGCDGTDARQILAGHIGMQHHTQSRGHQRHRLRAMPTHRVGPSLELETVQQRERPCLADALQHAEDATDMHHRGVDDRDPLPQFRRRRRPVRFRPDHAACELVVGEVDSLGWTGRSTG